MAPQEDEEACRGGHVEGHQADEIRQVRACADGLDQAAIDHHEERDEMLVVRPEDALEGQPAVDDERPLVAPERQVARHHEDEQHGFAGDDREQAPVAERPFEAAGEARGSAGWDPEPANDASGVARRSGWAGLALVIPRPAGGRAVRVR